LVFVSQCLLPSEVEEEEKHQASHQAENGGDIKSIVYFSIAFPHVSGRKGSGIQQFRVKF
jgi:hypothetical protein